MTYWTSRQFRRTWYNRRDKMMNYITAHFYAHPLWTWWCHWVYYPLKRRTLPGHSNQEMFDCPLCEVAYWDGDEPSQHDHYGCECAFNNSLYDYEDEDEEW